MNSLKIFLPLIFLSFMGCAHTGSELNTQVKTVTAAEKKVSGFDQALATKLGADDYGMKSYVMVVLTSGPKDAEITDKEARASLFRGHFANMKRLANEGKLVLAGPLMEAKPKRGLFIFNVKTLAEAEAIVATDPTVKAGIFNYELTKYYGSAALMQINEIHKSLQKKAVE